MGRRRAGLGLSVLAERAEGKSQRGGARRQDDTQRAHGLDDHDHQPGRARRHRFDARDQSSGGRDRRRQSHRRAADDALGCCRTAPHDEPVVFVRPPRGRRRRRQRNRLAAVSGQSKAVRGCPAGPVEFRRPQAARGGRVDRAEPPANRAAGRAGAAGPGQAADPGDPRRAGPRRLPLCGAPSPPVAWCRDT